MIVAAPTLVPLTVVATPGALVAPCGIVNVVGDAVATEGLLLARVMVTPAGAAVPNVTGKLRVLPDMTVTLTGNWMPPAAACVTDTVAFALAMLDALAVIVTDPPDTPVTGTETVEAPIPKLTVAGTVATVGPLELRLTVNAAEAGADRLRARFCVAVPLMVRLVGEKLIVVAGGAVPPVTCTWELTVANPDADAVTVTEPALLPVTTGAARDAVVVPSGIVKVQG